MDINEIKDIINKNEYYSLDDILNLEQFKNVELKCLDVIETDEHRWYTIDTCVYNFAINGLSIGKLAIREVGVIKSEMMTEAACCVRIRAYNVREILKPTYEIIRDE